jgi:chromosome segregation ATPase
VFASKQPGFLGRFGPPGIRNEGRGEGMPTGNSVDAALGALRQAIAGLESAVDGRIEAQRENSEVEGEVRRVHADRSRLAQELDQSEFRANRLEEVNREVSRRLVTAMETIRAVLDN